MTAPQPIVILASVANGEQAALDAACHLISQALAHAAKGNAPGQAWPCECRGIADLQAIGDTSDVTLLVTSLAAALEHSDEPWPETEARLRLVYADLSARGQPVFICTLLRHVGQAVSADAAYRHRVRLRRLNLLAAELSRETGAFVIDLDRVLADIGAHALQTDYRLLSAAAVDVAGRAMAATIIANALDAVAAPDVQDAASSWITSETPRAALPTEIQPANIMAVGQGRRRQRVSTVNDAVDANQIARLLRQLFAGQLGRAEIKRRLAMAINRRGVRGSAVLLGTVLSQRALARVRKAMGGNRQ